MTVCYLEKLLSPPLLHGHHPGFRMFAARWKGLPQSSEHYHQADHSEEAEVPQAQTDAGNYSFEGLSRLTNPEMIDNSNHREKKKTLKTSVQNHMPGVTQEDITVLLTK